MYSIFRNFRYANRCFLTYLNQRVGERLYGSTAQPALKRSGHCPWPEKAATEKQQRFGIELDLYMIPSRFVRSHPKMGGGTFFTAEEHKCMSNKLYKFFVV